MKTEELWNTLQISPYSKITERLSNHEDEKIISNETVKFISNKSKAVTI